MSTDKPASLFGPNRTRVGHEDTEWSVWILGMDDIHDQPSLADALEFAAEHNAIFADLRMQSSSEYDPVLYAVVLHHGYAWNATIEHQLGLDCGHPQCGPCSFDRAQKHDEAVAGENPVPQCPEALFNPDTGDLRRCVVPPSRHDWHKTPGGTEWQVPVEESTEVPW